MPLTDIDGHDDAYDPFDDFNRSAGMGLVENPYPLFAMVRREHQIKNESVIDEVMGDDAMLGSEGALNVFTAYGFDAVQQVLKDGETFSSAGYAEVVGAVMGHTILEMDEPEHHTYRGLVQQAFSRKAMETWEAHVVRDVVNEHIDAFISPSRFTRDKHREWGLDLPFEILPYFVPAPSGPPPPAASPWPRPYFLFVGRLVHIKGLQTVLPVMRAYPDADLVVAGDGPEAAMLQQLAKLCGATWDKRAYTEFAAALGVGVLLRTASSFGVRQLVKLIPVYGQTAGAAAAAAASFAATYAMGKAATYFLIRRQQGRRTAEVASVYREALQQAFGLAKARGAGDKGAGQR